MSFSARKCKNYQPKLLFNKANKDTKKVLKSLIHRGLKRFLWYNLLIDREVKAVALFFIGGGRYGVKNHSHNYSRESRRLVSVKDALQLMLAFSTFTTELIKISKKK